MRGQHNAICWIRTDEAQEAVSKLIGRLVAFG